MSISFHTYDVVIVGAGGAGLRAALGMAAAGFQVAVISKVFPTRSHTVAAQGGIGAALGNMGDDDNWQNHFYDTVKGGDWLGDQDAIQVMCQGARDAVIELENMGVPFSRNPDGTIYQRPFGGHTLGWTKDGASDTRGTKKSKDSKTTHTGIAKRACAAADRTGHAILHTLYQQCLKRNVTFFNEYFALDLVMDVAADGQKKCRGVVAWCLQDGTLHAFAGGHTVLATGGYGRVYQTATSAYSCTGDGGGMVARAGLFLQDMEFVQFHPTGLYDSGCLISEGARGEGGILKNANGDAFMTTYAPQTKDLASRDVVSRAIATEIAAGRGCGPNKDHVWLHLDHLPAATLKEKLPGIVETARIFAGVDAAKAPIPVCPTVHYNMGGIPTNRFGEVQDPTESAPERLVDGLMSIGESACVSVHGANRLGTNSLLDLIVFGRQAALRLAEKAKPHMPPPPLTKDEIAPAIDRFHGLLNKGLVGNKGLSVGAVRQKMQTAMSRCCGVFRNEPLMQKGRDLLAQAAELLPSIRLSDRSLIWNTDLVDLLELHNLMPLAFATLESALFRKESRGSHTREDFPNRNDADLFHTFVQFPGHKKPEVEKLLSQTAFHKQAVTLKPLSGDVPPLPPGKRNY